MAQLPDENIVALPQPGSRRPVSSIDVSGYARGASAIGTGVEALGKGITSGGNDVVAALKAQREYARANATLNAAAIKRGNEIEKETNPAGLPEKIQTQLGEDAEIAAQQIKDPRAREMLVLAAREQSARLAGVAATRASHLAREAGKAQDIATLNALTEGAIQSSDPNAVPVAMQSASDVMDGWTWMDRGEVETAKALFAQDFAVRKFDALPLAERHAAFAGGRYVELVAAMPAETRDKRQMATQREFEQARVKASYDAFDAIRRTLDDAASGQVPLPARDGIESNPDLRPSDRSRALAVYDRAAGEVVKLKEFQARLLDPNAVFDSSDQETRNLVNRYFISRGGTNEALREIVQRTGILPAIAVTAFKRSLTSGTADAATQTLQTLDALPPQAFVNLADAPAMTEALDTYRAKVLTGKSAAAAAQEYLDDKKRDAHMPPELKKAKEEELRGVGGYVTYEKMRSALQLSAWRAWGLFAAAEAGVSNADRIRMLHDFRQVVKEIYLSQHSTDLDQAVNKAAIRFGRSYGVSTVHGPDPTDPKQAWGTPRLVRFAPASWPGYAAAGIQEKPETIEELVRRVAADAIEGKMEDPSGWRVDPTKIVLQPLNYERTEASFTQAGSAKPPEYLLSYQDKFGLIQTIGTIAVTPEELREAHWKIKKPIFEAGQRAAMVADDQRIKSTADRLLSPANREHKQRLIAQEQKVFQDVLDEESRNTPGPADIFPGRPAGRLGPARP